MANKAISELPQALNVNNQDLFVLEQSGIAKKLTAETFITEQGIIDALAEALDGHGGIQSVTLSSVSGRIRTYLITFTDGSATTFQVLDGTSISRIEKTSSAGLVDTYTVFMNDGTTSFFQVRNGQDGSATWDQINGKAPAITDTASGAIVNFPDGADDIPVTSLVADIEPKQSGSGDPSPSNIRPISGWTGCNVKRTGKNLLPNSNAQDTSTRVRLGESVVGNGVWFKAGTYRISYAFKDGTTPVTPFWRTYKNGVHGAVNNSWIVRLTEDTNVKVWLYNSSGVSVNNVDWAMVELGSTATAYEPYQGNTVTLSWQTEAGTVYGGTIDVATGLLTVNRAMVDLGTKSWSKVANNNYANFSCLNYFTDAVYDAYAPTFICSIYKSGANNTVSPSEDNYVWLNPQKVLRIKDLSKDSLTAEEFATAMSGVQLCYELATPQTYQLTPQEVLHTLYGTNNVWADIGNVSVTYPADTKMFIEKLTMPTEDDLVANQAISSGTFFMVGNTLYKATAAIANGATITPGTNATKLSLADALNLLNT